MISIIESPAKSEYLNDVEFLIGYDEDREICVGMKLGSKASEIVSSIVGCIHIPQICFSIADRVAKIVEISGLPLYTDANGSGHWKSVRIRLCNGKVMLIIYCQSECPQEVFEAIQKDFSDIDSILYVGGRKEFKVIFGAENLVETLHEMKFVIGPVTSFPANLGVTENLINELITRKKLGKDVVIIDLSGRSHALCLALANTVSEVIVLERDQKVIEEIRNFEELNKVRNVTIREDRIEDLSSDFEVAEKQTLFFMDVAAYGERKEVFSAVKRLGFIKDLFLICENPEVLIREVEQSLTDGDDGCFEIGMCLGIDVFPHTEKMHLLLELCRNVT
jgi:tRNA/tmRNA/rRNA uracil-C5-methylase (TrmA/RlmC/RlmD family)